jgi:glucokinase
MKKQKLTVGIDIGGTNTAIGFVSDDGKYLAGSSIPTISNEDAEKFILRLVQNIKSMYTQISNDYVLAGIGVAAPSANYFSGIIESPSNLPWDNVDFVSTFKYHFKVPVVIINDANAAALGEFYYGHAKGLKNFIVITLGTGVGAGIFIDGNLLYGERGLAGEMGHIVVEPNGRKCNCGRSGCLETYVSATGMRRTVIELMANYNDPSELRNVTFNQLTGKMISEFAIKGDPIAIRAFDLTGKILGKEMANLAAYFSPEIIVLFGGLLHSGDLLLGPTRRYFDENLLNVHKDKIQVLISELNNGTAGVFGASKLVLKQIQNNSFKLNKSIKVQ